MALNLPDGLRVGHVDMDAFFASVESLTKPSLAGKPVVVGGVGGRGVVATANYAARRLGVHSAMPTWQARARAPHAAYLTGRMAAYGEHSRAAFAWVYAHFDVVEQVALDELYIDLASGHDLPEGIDAGSLASLVRQQVWDATGLTCSVGLGRHKLGAKLASEQAKPAGVCVLGASAEAALLATLPIDALPGVGPVSADKLRSAGFATVAAAADAEEIELTGLLGGAHGRLVWALAHGDDPREVVSAREAKSVGAEHTLAADLRSRSAVEDEVERAFRAALARLARAGHAARTVTVKIRYADFTSETRAVSLPAPTDEESVLRECAWRALAAANVPGVGVRLVGVTFSGLDDDVQLALAYAADEQVAAADEPAAADGGPAEAGDATDPYAAGAPVTEPGRPGADVWHPDLGTGWLVGAGHGVASVRFEGRGTPPATSRVVALDGRLRYAAPPSPAPPDPRDVPPWQPAG